MVAVRWPECRFGLAGVGARNWARLTRPADIRGGVRRAGCVVGLGQCHSVGVLGAYVGERRVLAHGAVDSPGVETRARG